MRCSRGLLFMLSVLLWLQSGLVLARSVAVPEVLLPWVDWALDDADRRACALADAGAGSPQCAWPGELSIELDAKGGRFEQSWTLQAEQWVPIPGGAGQWPQQVSVNGTVAAVVERENHPAVRLPAGDHRLQGRFQWPRRPELLRLPPASVLVSLRLDGELVTPLRFDQRGGLWLGGSQPESVEQEPARLAVEVVRRIEDSLPLSVETRLMLEVAGAAREVLLGPVLLSGGIPLRLNSPLPARLLRVSQHSAMSAASAAEVQAAALDPESDAGQKRSQGKDQDSEQSSGQPRVQPGARTDAQPSDQANAGERPDAPFASADLAFLQIQVRPGRWTLTLESQHPGPVDSLRWVQSPQRQTKPQPQPQLQPRPEPEARSPLPQASQWPDQELWAFDARPALRQVELSGGQPVDPRLTRLPEAWRQLPTVLMRPGERLLLKTLRRGALGSDRVALQRILRLDFAGAGFSVRDQLSGQLEVRSRLDAEPMLRLGQVRVAGEPRLITRLPGNDRLEGVEVRAGALELSADARIETGPVALAQRLPASGWAIPLAGAGIELLLPPGWDLLAADGVDNLPDSWFGRWTLLDVFLVLIAAFAVARVWGGWWGLLMLVTLVLTWQEPGAPRWAWLHLILAAALLRLITGARWGAGAALESDRATKVANGEPSMPLLRDRAPRWLKTLVRVYRAVAILGLALIAIPFLITEMRDGLFPQLDRQGAGLYGLVAPAASPVEVGAMARAPRAEPVTGVAYEAAEAVADYASKRMAPAPSNASSAPTKPLPSFDPDARVQTGAGMPEWQWRGFQLGWNGPVPVDQQIVLWLRPPWAALLLAILSLFLVPLMALRLSEWLPVPKASVSPQGLGSSVQSHRSEPTPPKPVNAATGATHHRPLTLWGGLLLCGLVGWIGLSLQAVQASPWASADPLLAAERVPASVASPASVQLSAAEQSSGPDKAQRSEPIQSIQSAGGASGAVRPGVLSADPQAAAAFPSSALLETLRQRLLAPDDCVPRCAEIARLRLELQGEALRLILVVDAVTPVGLPVPGAPEAWMPSQIQLDGKPLQRIRRADTGIFSVPVPAGRHLVALSGSVAGLDQLLLSLPLRPRLVETDLPTDWQLEGLSATGVPGEQLQLTRRQPSAASGLTAGADDERDADQNGTQTAAGQFPPLLQVTRQLRFGLEWRVETAIERLSPANGPVSLRVPLLPNESVNSAEVQVNAAGVLIALGAKQRRMAWSSTLTPVDELRLSASTDPRISEVWRLEASPLWHLQAEGFAPVQRQPGVSEAVQVYRPWPGETLKLQLSRPLAVPGASLTLDRSLYRLTPGLRDSEARLSLALRSTQGGRYPLPLPAQAELTQLSIDGQARPLTMQAGVLELPLIPGQQAIEVAWRSPRGFALRYQPEPLALGVSGVNAETQIAMPAGRWVLWTQGEGIGPAVQFWGLLLALLVFAWLLARARLTPLRMLDWFLLGIGLSQVSAGVAALVVLWLFALGWRQRLDDDRVQQLAAWRFNLVQVGLVLLSIAALLALLIAVEQGLLGSPEMQIAGNGSSATELRWYLDRQAEVTAPVTVFSVPIWVYRLLMLAWALWLATRLLRWLRWGWEALMTPVPWRSSRRERLQNAAADEALRVDL